MVSTGKSIGTWPEGHFIGGHLVLDLVNTVYNRAYPVADNELLGSPGDVLSWCESAGLFERAPRLTGAAAGTLVAEVHEVRQHAWAVFDAVARGEPASPEHLGRLLERAGDGTRAGHIRHIDPTLDELTAKWTVPGAIPAALALMAVHAYFTLPTDRIRACDRCGWLFLDSSRGGRRRWCSMSTCGNREKASRHRSVLS